jgi:hypothetical protein
MGAEKERAVADFNADLTAEAEADQQTPDGLSLADWRKVHEHAGLTGPGAPVRLRDQRPLFACLTGGRDEIDQ